MQPYISYQQFKNKIISIQDKRYKLLDLIGSGTEGGVFKAQMNTGSKE